MSEVVKQLRDFKDAVDANFCIRLADIWKAINPKNYGHWTADDEHKLAKAINAKLKNEGLIR